MRKLDPSGHSKGRAPHLQVRLRPGDVETLRRWRHELAPDADNPTTLLRSIFERLPEFMDLLKTRRRQGVEVRARKRR